jgi:hypothetical protein
VKQGLFLYFDFHSHFQSEVFLPIPTLTLTLTSEDILDFLAIQYPSIAAENQERKWYKAYINNEINQAGRSAVLAGSIADLERCVRHHLCHFVHSRQLNGLLHFTLLER